MALSIADSLELDAKMIINV